MAGLVIAGGIWGASANAQNVSVTVSPTDLSFGVPTNTSPAKSAPETVTVNIQGSGTVTFSPAVAQPVTPALAVGLGGDAGADDAGVVAGALEAAGALDGAEASLVPVVLDELHAPASSAVPSSSVMPSV